MFTMNDDFLTRFRKSPPPELEATLYKKLSQHAHSRLVAVRKSAWRLVLPILIIIAVLTFLVSPIARAEVLHAIQNIGGLGFELTNQVGPIDMLKVTVYPVSSGPLNTIRTQVPFHFGIPTWVPEGFVFQDDVGHASDYSWVMLGWTKGLTDLSLMVQKDDLYSKSNPVPVGSVEQVEVNHQRAVIIRGNIDLESGKWNPDARQLDLIWRQDHLVYTLSTDDPQMPVEGLVRMAESMK
jgi:hypothetical protein